MTRRTENLNAEKAVIGSIIRSDQAYWSVTGAQIGAEHFSDPTHRMIFEAVAGICEHSQRLTTQLLLSRMPTDCPNGASTVATVAVLVKLAEDVGSVEDYLDDLTEAYGWRKLESLLPILRGEGDSSTSTVDEILGKLTRGIDAIGAANKNEHPVPLNEAAEEALKETAANYQSRGLGPSSGIITGIPDIDAMTGPLFPGNLVTIAGGSGMGKTALLTQILFNVSEPSLDQTATAPGALFCMEMRARELARRLLARLTGISTRLQREGARLSEGNFEALSNATRSLSSNRLLLHDGGPMTVRQLGRAIRMAKRRHGSRLFGIDHLLEILPDNPRMSRIEVVSEAIGYLKQLAQDEQIIILALAQLTRESQKSDGWRVRSQALWGGDAIKQRSDILLGVAMPALWLRENRIETGERQHEKEAFDRWTRSVAEWTGKAEIGTLKVRDGEAGEYRPVPFDGERLWFG